MPSPRIGEARVSPDGEGTDGRRTPRGGRAGARKPRSGRPAALGAPEPERQRGQLRAGLAGEIGGESFHHLIGEPNGRGPVAGRFEPGQKSNARVLVFGPEVHRPARPAERLGWVGRHCEIGQRPGRSRRFLAEPRPLAIEPGLSVLRPLHVETFEERSAVQRHRHGQVLGSDCGVEGEHVAPEGRGLDPDLLVAAAGQDVGPKGLPEK